MNKPQFDPFKHHRRSIRYVDWDYRTPGYYFITICTFGRQNTFDKQAFQDVAKERLKTIATHQKFQHVVLDYWVVMPNHVHFIVWLQTWPETVLDQPEKVNGFTHVQPGSIGALVGTYKAQVTERVNNLRRQRGSKLWQKGYWDRVIRDEQELARIRQYIVDNPARWAEDHENLDAIFNKMVFHP